MTPAGDVEHLHNQLIAGIYGNVTREMPDHGVASWVSANDKPTTGAGSKPVSGDAAEQRLRTEVMQLPSRDRRRIKDISQNEVWDHECHYLSYRPNFHSLIPKRRLRIYLGNYDALKHPGLQIMFLRVLVV